VGVEGPGRSRPVRCNRTCGGREDLNDRWAFPADNRTSHMCEMFTFASCSRCRIMVWYIWVFRRIVRWIGVWIKGRDGAAVWTVTPCCERNEVVTCTNTIVPTPRLNLNTWPGDNGLPGSGWFYFILFFHFSPLLFCVRRANLQFWNLKWSGCDKKSVHVFDQRFPWKIEEWRRNGRHHSSHLGPRKKPLQGQPRF